MTTVAGIRELFPQETALVAGGIIKFPVPPPHLWPPLWPPIPLPTGPHTPQIDSGGASATNSGSGNIHDRM